MGTVSERVWAEIDLDAIAHNLRCAKVRAGAPVGVMAVVKSNGYGHGAIEVGREVEQQGAAALGVATPSEGIELRRAGIRIPILVMGSCLHEEVEAAVEHGLSLSLSPAEVFWPIVEAAKRLGRCACVHLLVDTGMARDGLSPEAAVELAEQVRDTPEVHLEGTYTHLATALLTDKSFCHEQITRFNRTIAELLRRNISPGILHCASSGALFTLPSSHFDMVRQGITLYGVAPSEEVEAQTDLRPAMTVKTRVLAIGEIERGESVGYLRQFVAERRTRLATLAMGYADGFRLGLTNKGHVLLNGRRAPVVGRVMMDCTVADVTSLPGVRVGDEVVVIGKSGRNEVRANDLAMLLGSSPYEVLCSLGPRVRRVYVRGGKPALLEAGAMRRGDAASPALQSVDRLSRQDRFGGGPGEPPFPPDGGG